MRMVRRGRLGRCWLLGGDFLLMRMGRVVGRGVRGRRRRLRLVSSLRVLWRRLRLWRRPPCLSGRGHSSNTSVEDTRASRPLRTRIRNRIRASLRSRTRTRSPNLNLRSPSLVADADAGVASTQRAHQIEVALRDADADVVVRQLESPGAFATSTGRQEHAIEVSIVHSSTKSGQEALGRMKR